MDSSTFKIILAGDGGVGKTSLVKRWIFNEWGPKYIATLGTEHYEMMLNTNYGPITLNLWDCAGQEKFGGIKEDYYIGANGALLVFDLTSKLSYRNISDWDASIQRICEGIPTVVVGTKSDIAGRKLHASDITFPHTRGYHYAETSAKNITNVKEPLLLLARQLTGKPDLAFV
jgi:GTP-binding nuclear protein Ran